MNIAYFDVSYDIGEGLSEALRILVTSILDKIYTQQLEFKVIHLI